jgi:hypothetical protein
MSQFALLGIRPSALYIPVFCFPAGIKPIPKHSPMKPGEKLAVKSSPVKVGMKRKATDETPCLKKVRVRIVVLDTGQFGSGTGDPGSCV